MNKLKIWFNKKADEYAYNYYNHLNEVNNPRAKQHNWFKKTFSVDPNRVIELNKYLNVKDYYIKNISTFDKFNEILSFIKEKSPILSIRAFITKLIIKNKINKLLAKRNNPNLLYYKKPVKKVDESLNQKFSPIRNIETYNKINQTVQKMSDLRQMDYLKLEEIEPSVAKNFKFFNPSLNLMTPEEFNIANNIKATEQLTDNKLNSTIFMEKS